MLSWEIFYLRIELMHVFFAHSLPDQCEIIRKLIHSRNRSVSLFFYKLSKLLQFLYGNSYCIRRLVYIHNNIQLFILEY